MLIKKKKKMMAAFLGNTWWPCWYQPMPSKETTTQNVATPFVQKMLHAKVKIWP